MKQEAMQLASALKIEALQRELHSHETFLLDINQDVKKKLVF